MTSIFVSPLYHPLNDSGQIQPGCYLQFFNSQTDAPTEVYANPGLAGSLGIEVESDASGRFPLMRLNPHVLYRVKLFAADDTLIYDLDEIYPVPGRWVGEVSFHDGPLEDLPVGWHLCNGSNGTRDVRGKFIAGAGGAYALGDTGGSATASGTTDPGGGHSHGGATQGHALTAEENGPHGHQILAANNSGDSNADGWLNTNDMSVPGEDVGPHEYRLDNLGGTEIIEPSGDGDPHTHAITAAADHTHDISDVSTLPPFLALYPVKFTGV